MRRVFVMCAAAVMLMAASVTPTFLQDDPDYCPCHGQNCSCGLSPNSYWPRYCGHNDICDCARQGETCCGNDGTICSTTAVCSDCGPPQSSTPCKESKYPWNADGCCPAKDGIICGGRGKCTREHTKYQGQFLCTCDMGFFGNACEQNCSSSGTCRPLNNETKGCMAYNLTECAAVAKKGIMNCTWQCH